MKTQQVKSYDRKRHVVKPPKAVSERRYRVRVSREQALEDLQCGGIYRLSYSQKR